MTILISDNNVFDGIFSRAILLPEIKTIDEALNLFGLSPEQINNESDIKQAYKKLAFQYHPDVNQDPDSTRNFQIIQNALSLIENYFGSYNSDTGNFTRQKGKGFNWKNDPIYKDIAEKAKTLNPEEVYQTHTKVEDNEKIKKMKAEIERIKNGEGGVWDEYKGSQRVFRVNLNDGTLVAVNYGNSRSKNAYRNFLYEEFGQEVLSQFEEQRQALNEIFKEKLRNYVNSGTSKDEAYEKAKEETYKEFEDANMLIKVPENQLQIYRKKRINQINYYIKKIQKDLSAQQRTEELYDSGAPDGMLEMITESQPSVASGQTLFTQMQNLGIFKIPTKGRRKGKITIDPSTVDNLTSNPNPNVPFAAGVGLLLRDYIDSTFNDRWLTKHHTDPYVDGTAKGLAGIHTIKDPKIFSYPIEKEDIDKFVLDPENIDENIKYDWKRRGMPTKSDLLLNNAKRGIYMIADRNDPNASEYKKSSYEFFSKPFINDSAENLDYAQRVNAAEENRELIEKNMKYYALQLGKALIQSGKADINRRALKNIEWNEDDRDVYQKYNDFFSRYF